MMELFPHAAPPRCGAGPPNRNGTGSAVRARRRLFSLPLSVVFFVVLQFLVLGCAGQKDPIKNFCRRFGHQTAVLDYQGRQRLYIDGGLINWDLEVYPNNYTNTWLLYQDLSTVDPAAGMPPLYANLSKNSSIPDVNGGVLWEDNVNKKFYLFGGEYYQEPPSTSFVLYAYDVIFDDWISLGPPQGASISSVSYGAGVAISDRGEGYYYGGWMSNNSVSGWTGPPLASTGLVRYDMASNTWSNSTGPDATRRAEGAMVYIPAGDGGMLIYFGGITDPFSNGTIVGQSLKTIFVYDVLSSKWYTQTASGTVPDMRRRFCAGVTWAPDQSSYNIYLYGGASMPPNTSGYDDIYVLSIPSFTWIKLYPTDGSYTGQAPHHSLSCNVVSGAQMLIIGGTFPINQTLCDAPSQWGTHNLDMGEQNKDGSPWALYATNKTSYVVPDPVVRAVGGSGSGGATKTAPASGWDNPDLQVLMTRKASVASRTPTRDVPGPTGASGPAGPLSTGAIVGIAVGGAVVVIAALAGLCFFVARHRKNRRQPKPYGSGGRPPPIGGPAQAYYDSMGGGGGGGGGGWSPHSSRHTPTSPYPTSPYANRPMQQQQQHAEPAELAATGTNAWSPPGAGYELGPHHYHQHSPSMSGTGTGTGTGTGSATGGSTGMYDPPPGAKVDDQGRIWVPQVSSVQMSPHYSSAGPTPSGDFPSPGFGSPGRSASPQELGSDLHRGGGGDESPWDNGQRVHHTYYHP